MEAAAQHQLFGLYALTLLGMMMSRTENENAIAGMASAAVRQVVRCSPVAVFVRGPGGLQLLRGDAQIEHTSDFPAWLDIETPVAFDDHPWARSFPLRGLTGAIGYLVVGADGEPGHNEQFLLGILAQQTGSALGAARAFTEQRDANRRCQQAVSLLERQTATMRVMAGVAAEEVDGAHLASSLSALTGLPVSVEDHFGHRLSWAASDGREPRRLSRRRFDALAYQAQAMTVPVRSGKRWVAAATVTGEVLGLLVLHDPDATATEADMFALSHASTVLSVELQRVRSIAHAELRSRRELADELLAGKAGNQANSRGDALGHDLSQPQQVVALGWDTLPREDLVHTMLDAMMARLDTTFLVARRQRHALIIAPVSDRWSEAHRAAQGCNGLGGTPVSLGVGRPCEHLRRIPRSCLEATQALSVRMASNAPSGVTMFGELGVFRVLAAATTNPELQSFALEWLGPLISYDEHHGSDLVPTLSAFLEAGGHYNKTASVMTIHRSTLRYRLKRIRDVTGLDLSDVDTRFNLHVATRAWKLLAPS